MQFERALNLILDYEPHTVSRGGGLSDEELENIDLEANKVSKEEAIKLYKLVHQRYIQTEQGLKKMEAKFLRGDFGFCPRVLCDM